VQLLDAAEAVLEERSGMTFPRDLRGDPTSLEGCIVAEPVRLAGRLRGVLALEVTPRPEPELRSLLEQMRWGVGWLHACFQREGEQAEAAVKSRLEVVLGVMAATVEQERFHGAATAFATELATELGCDRVSVALLRGRRAQVRALSHSAHFVGKTNLVRAIEAAMDEALDQQATVVHPSAPAALPQATHAHAELSRHHGAGSLCTVPLVHAGSPCGAITLERPEARPFDPATVKLCEAAAALAGPALVLHSRDDRWLVTKAAEALRTRLTHLLGPHHVVLKLASLAVLGLVLFLTFAKGDYRVTADTVLEPAVLRAAVAPFDGYIAEAPVRAGDLVTEGQLLASLDDRDLQLERNKWVSETDQALKQYRQAMAERDAAQAEIVSAVIAEARAELDRIEDHLSRTELRAAFDGVVVTGDLSQKLGAPAARGDVLFEVAPLDAYRVVLQVDESDIPEVALGQTGRLILSSLPEDPLALTIEKITPVSKAEEGRNFFRVEARLDGAIERLRPGIEGVAKIEIDRRRLIWIWTHSAVDWLRLTLWAWTP
jgi:hypothetical protein